ncbi:Asp23/Gls24 family envelope stress response protein [Nocardia cyriacigeorgica]|uniref:Asp23/Gls24 family envelope stress response protein n=1 Tax=Nocardia cyriacigeorgica TaxID=135487 RepID=A0A6P1D183_9NOCA|nr:Asp23/Gls24 family envelope stress response protein [Nocardia cyriacigeorgica]NEW40948.1 Asp23/Gls24 family envelope stress response protein [Nocardia cyriacigeorgica]NEW44255.1 Asp23/Gls24 family envelope stress response protein [Nocardia cyriacigeorgica]NEW51246.1 Asp23/Gls24 family envelope stress response protein [Nocardia cyriacigeorgica]NEW59157.1 Asp23/Gls24 family envelope stress response protein [Nocardia cyriacigeorgica]
MTGAAVPVELPGRTTISERVVRRIAAHAALEVPGVDRGVKVEATVSGDRAALAVRLPVRFPEPVGRVTEECRAHLRERTAELTGIGVSRVDIVVSELTTETIVPGRVQ